MLRKLIAAVVLTSLSAGVALAQLPFVGFVDEQRSRENALQRAEGERQYRAAANTIPDRKASKDPWKTVRSGPRAVPPPPDRHRVE